VPRWDAATETAADCSISLPGLERAGKPFEVLVEAALATAEGAAEFKEAMKGESQQILNELFCALYLNVQSHTLRVDEFCKLIDLVGTKRRREIQLGPILRSINGRSCPAAVEKRSFEVIGSEAYCQICHRVGVENGVSRCGGCGVVAYCSKRHAQMDSGRHQSWCGELLFSRVLQSALPWSNYTQTSRQLTVPYTPTSVLALPAANGDDGKANGEVAKLSLPAGWRPFFDLHKSAKPTDTPTADSGKKGGGGKAGSSGSPAGATLDAFDEVLATDSLSSVMTVAYALTKLGLGVEEPGGSKRLCLHLLGADHERELPWSELFAWLPQYTEIAMILIGPHTPTLAVQDVKGKPVPPGCKMTVQGVAGCFHELSPEAARRIPKPDAVFALNSGLIFYPTWAATVDRVLVRMRPSLLARA
jgi:hypothetical protein